MGADLYINPVYEEQRQEWEPKFQEAIKKKRNSLADDSAERELAELVVERYFDKIYERGYLKHPVVGLRRLSDKLRTFVRKPSVKPFIRLTSTAVDTGAAGSFGKVARDALGMASDDAPKQFHPVFISLGAAELPLYREVLKERLPGAKPPAGTGLLFESMLRGRASHMWLNVGEEKKLEREAKDNPRCRLSKYRKAKKALDAFGCVTQ